MADYDDGVDLAGDAFDSILNFLKTNWEFGKGHERGNEYNCTNSENMCYALDDLGVRSWPGFYADYFLDFFKDVMAGLERTAEDNKRKGNKKYPKHWSGDWLKMMNKFISDIESNQ